MDYKSPNIEKQILLEFVLVTKHKWVQHLRYMPQVKDEICALCHETMEGDAVLVTPCDHRFHDICVLDSLMEHQWLKCPRCSQPYDFSSNTNHFPEKRVAIADDKENHRINVPTQDQLLMYQNNHPDPNSDNDDDGPNRYPDYDQIEALQNENQFDDGYTELDPLIQNRMRDEYMHMYY